MCSALSTITGVKAVEFRIAVAFKYDTFIVVDLNGSGAITQANIPDTLGGPGSISGADLGILGIHITDVSGGAPYTVCARLPYKADVLGTAQTLTTRVNVDTTAGGWERGTQKYELVLVSVILRKK